MNSASRARGFQRKEQQEALLNEVNRLLTAAEEVASKDKLVGPQLPMFLIVGAPRSGTTLLLQWLAASGHFAYPSNLLSRFFRAPYTGALIQQLITDPTLDYRNELVDARAYTHEWDSEVGKTRGMLQPHEFFYFWRRFFPIDQARKMTPNELEDSDPAGFAAGWAALESAFNKPIAAKGILLQYDIPLLAQWLPRAIFIHIQRDSFFNIQSILESREKVGGSREAWFSVRPPEYEWLQNEDSYTQVAGQVLFTNNAIKSALANLPIERSISVQYEDFCSQPIATWEQIRSLLRDREHELASYNGPQNFSATNVIRCTPGEANLIRSAHQNLVGAVEAGNP